jgi:hypothetical protein
MISGENSDEFEEFQEFPNYLKGRVIVVGFGGFFLFENKLDTYRPN